MFIRNDTYDKYLGIVRNYLDAVLKLGTKSKDDKIIFANGWDFDKNEPLSWVFENEHRVYISNLALQQNLFRSMCGFSNLTGEATYKKASMKTISTYYQYYQHECGLLHWGGHRFIDFESGNVVGIRDKKGDVHELKECFPYYDLMFETDKQATIRYIRSFWNAHVYKWKTLEINRHGYYEVKGERLWANEYEKTQPFREAAGLSFINAANDLIYAAGKLFFYNNEKGALIWMTRMIREYEKAKDPVTGLGAYQFNQARKISNPPSDDDTLSMYGDRALRQFGDDFKQVLEGRMLLKPQAESLYYHTAVVWTRLGKKLGVFGTELKNYTYNGLKAFIKYAYQMNSNTIKPMLTDGTSLVGYTLKRNGYYGKRGETLKEYAADEKLLYSLVVVYCETPDQQLWRAIRNICTHVNAGDPGEKPGELVKYDEKNITNNSELAVMSYVELYNLAKYDGYLELAVIIAENMIKAKQYENFFIRSKNNPKADFDSVCPLALLQICAAIVNKSQLIPEYMTGHAYIHGKYRFEDSTVASYTTKMMLE